MDGPLDVTLQKGEHLRASGVRFEQAGIITIDLAEGAAITRGVKTETVRSVKRAPRRDATGPRR